MTRPPRKKHAVYVPPPPEPALSPAQLDEIAGLVLAGDVYRAGSVNECAALLAVIRKRGYVPKRRTEREQHDAPWLFIVVQDEAQIESASTTEDDKSRLDKRHPATAQDDPLRGGN